MSVRRAIVECVPEELNVTAFCREHGISTWFFWNLRRQFEERGAGALEPRSRAPHRVANRCDPDVEDLIVAKRKELGEAGLDNGPATIAFHLRDLKGVPSEATIWRVLKRRGFIVDDPSKSPKTTARSFSSERANDCWQVDDTGWELADGTEVKIINVLDDCSRVLVASVAVGACTGAAALDAFARAAQTWGWPARFLSDNAKAFCHVLAAALGAMGIGAGHSRPYHPQTNGKVERLHQTLKRYLVARPRPATIAELQAQLDAFSHVYNHARPHRSLGRRFPADVWASTPKSGPADQPVNATTSTYRGTVDKNGTISVGHRLRISLGAAYTGATATTVITGTACHVFVDGHLARQLTIDPTRNRQPLHGRPGRPRRLP